MSKNKTFLCRVCSKPLQEELDLLVRAIHSRYVPWYTCCQKYGYGVIESTMRRPTTEDLVILHHSESQLVSLTEVLRDVLRETKVSGIVISSQGVENIMVALRDEERRGERVLKDVLDTVPLMIDDQVRIHTDGFLDPYIYIQILICRLVRMNLIQASSREARSAVS